MKKFLKNFVMFALMIALGVGIVVFLKKTKKPLEHQATEMAARPVSVMTVSKQNFEATVTAYGNVEPASVLQGKSQVSGKVTYVHPSLKVGGSIKAGEVVTEIDPEDYQTSLEQTQADLAASTSQLAQLNQEERNVRQALTVAEENLKVAQANLNNVRRQDAPVRKNNEYIQKNLNLSRKNLQITQQNLALAKKEQARLQKLAQQRLIALSQAESQQQQVLQLEQQVVGQQQAIVQMEQQLSQQDQSEAKQDQSVLQQQQAILQQQQQVTELQGQLKTFESRRNSANAQVKRVEQQVKGQKTNLGRTKVNMPFSARISAVHVEVGSVVAVGTALFEADNNAGVEIRAELPTQHLQALLAGLKGQTLDYSAANMPALMQSLNLQAKVKIVGAGEQEQRSARVDRLAEAIDPVSRTLGVVVAVDQPYDNIVGQQLPLLKGMYVEVTLSALQNDAIVIPRKAVHQGRVYVMNAEQRLEIRPITIQSQEGEQVVIASGLAVGEQLIVNDLIPVIPGMPLLAKNQASAADKPAEPQPEGVR